MVNAGISPLVINQSLGNNDGRNLSAEAQFKSKEVSKSSVVDDMVDANHLLYKPPVPGPKGEHPDHIIIIKCPAVGYSPKRAIDEYRPKIFCGGRSNISIFNECEDSLLATPLILDLAILAELLTHVKYKDVTAGETEFSSLYSILSFLSYMLKAPLVKPGTDAVNSPRRQRNTLEVFLKACLGLEDSTNLLLRSRASNPGAGGHGP